MKKILTFFMLFALSIPIWASEHTVTIHRNEQMFEDATGVYYIVKDGIMMTFTDGLDNENYLQERNNSKFEINSYNYLIKRIVFHCVDNTTTSEQYCYAWGPTTISVYQNFYNQSAPGTYVANDYTGTWTGTTNHIQFQTMGKPVRFGSVDIVYDKLDGNIFELVTNNSQIVDGKTYVLVSQYFDKAMRFKQTEDQSFPVTDIVDWVGPANNPKKKVKVDGSACLFKMEGVKDSTVNGSVRKVAWLNTMNGYIRISNSGDGKDLTLASKLEYSNSSYLRAIMYISSNEYNYLGWFKSGNCNINNTIRYDYDNELVKIKYITGDNNGRLWLYKLAESFDITTECQPAGGGYITLGDGVVNSTSQQGETVNFTVNTNWGWRVNEVIVTNTTTGETVPVTLVSSAEDGNSYSFIMPEGDVHIVASFYETVPDLYMLGTPMGRTGWTASGPKFNYNANNEEYYLDVYFKGVNPSLPADQQGYGFFSLAQHVDNNTVWQTSPNNSGDWSQVYGRLAAAYNNLDVHNGTTNEVLYGDRPDNAFRIPAGVYRIRVNRAMNRMSIDEIPLHLTFDPVSGSEIYLGDDVTISSDLQTIVHGIAAQYSIQETNQQFKNSTDGGANYDNDNTATISQLGETTVLGEAWIDYISVTGSAVYNVIIPPHDITTVCTPSDAGFITVNNAAWENETVTFTVEHYPDFELNSVTVTVDGQDQTVEVTHNSDGSYSFIMPDGDVTITADFTRTGYIFRLVTRTEEIMSGKTYTIINQDEDLVLNKITPQTNPNYFSSTNIVEWIQPDKTMVKVDNNAALITFEDLSFSYIGAYDYAIAYLKSEGGYLGFSPIPDTQFAYLTLEPTTSTTAKFTSRILSTAGFNPNIFSYYNYEEYGNDWTINYFSDYGSFMFRENIIPYDVTYLYKIAEPYHITLQCEPDGCGELQLTGGNVGETAIEGTLVTVMPDPADNYAVTDVVVMIEGIGQTIDVTSNIDGSYSFIMPDADVVVTAYFGAGHKIITVCDPTEGGEIICRESASVGDQVEFEVQENNGYALQSVTITYQNQNNQQESVNYNVQDPCLFDFVMPDGDVTITAHFNDGYYDISTVVIPSDNGYIDYWSTDGTDINNHFLAGDEVVFEVFWDDDLGYVLDSVAVTVDGTDVVVDITAIEGNYLNSFIMPEGNVTITAYLRLNTPLHYIEDQYSLINNDDEVTVTDELIGTWMAKQYVWAKDQVRSNEYIEKSSEGEIKDYVIDLLKWQDHDWDQSNWVMLDFSEIPNFDWNSPGGRQIMNRYVDHKIKAGTIKGIYHCGNRNDLDDAAEAFVAKANHVIVLSELPEVIESEETQGYPGYIPDPREEEESLTYMYNQYTTANFIYFNTVPEGVNYWLEEGELEPLEPYDFNLYFMRPKNQEVAHVWGVWAGTMTYEDDFTHEEVTKDVFETYIPNGRVTPSLNAFGIPGAFAVDRWEFNRLPSPDEDPVYGKPGVDNDVKYALKTDTAYLFHIAIQYDVPDPQTPIDPMKAPKNAFMDNYRSGEKAADTAPSFYRVYPLDLGSHQSSYTAVNEVRSSSSTEIESIRYYNVMGQESFVPFEGINIEVIRYKDGHSESRKILR